MFGRMAMCAMVLLVGACAGQGAETSVTTTSVAVVTTTTSPQTTTTTTVEATTTTVDEWESITAWRGGPAGEYRTSVFEPAFRFTTTSAFQPGGRECEDVVGMVKGGSGVYLFNLDRGTVEETLNSITGLEGVDFGESENVEVGGASGVRVVGESSASPIVANVCAGDVFGFETGAELTLYVIDVAGETVSIVMEKAPGTSSLFDGQAQDIIDSIEWKALAET